MNTGDLGPGCASCKAGPHEGPCEQRRSCASCDYWALNDEYSSGEVGTCRRSPPHKAAHGPTGYIGWPAAASHDWCGEYSSKTIALQTEGQAMAVVKTVGLELQHAGQELHVAAEKLKALGKGMDANRAHIAHKRAMEQAGALLG